MIEVASGNRGSEKWMRGRSAHVRGALLGLVLERPGHGHDLANRLSKRLGQTWRLDDNDVYRLLEGLEAEGLVRAREEPRRDKRIGTRVVYHPTASTSEAMARWIQTLLPREPFRLGLHAKLAVAREQDLPGVRSALAQYRRECLEHAQMMSPADGAPASWSAMFMDCTREGIYGMLQAEIDWANRTLRRIEEFARRTP